MSSTHKMILVVLFLLFCPVSGKAQTSITTPSGYGVQTSPGIHLQQKTDPNLKVITPIDTAVQNGYGNPAITIQNTPQINLGATMAWSACVGSAAKISVCGQYFPLNSFKAGPAFSTENSTAILTMPPPYVPDHFLVSCAGNAVMPNVTISAPDVSCKFQPCKNMKASVCGREFLITDEVEVGKTVSLSWLSKPSDLNKDDNPLIDAQCSIDNGQQSYAINMRGMFCSKLPCPAGTVKLCDTDIAISEGTPANSVLNLTMPAPFVPDPYTVQCISSNGNAPVYQLVDHTFVTCQQKPAP